MRDIIIEWLEKGSMSCHFLGALDLLWFMLCYGGAFVIALILGLALLFMGGISLELAIRWVGIE